MYKELNLNGNIKETLNMFWPELLKQLFLLPKVPYIVMSKLFKLSHYEVTMISALNQPYNQMPYD
jgi:hypothetical protein